MRASFCWFCKSSPNQNNQRLHCGGIGNAMFHDEGSEQDLIAGSNPASANIGHAACADYRLSMTER